MNVARINTILAIVITIQCTAIITLAIQNMQREDCSVATVETTFEEVGK